MVIHEEGDINLPTYSDLRLLFPPAQIEREWLFGLTKAFYVWEWTDESA